MGDPSFAGNAWGSQFSVLVMCCLLVLCVRVCVCVVAVCVFAWRREDEAGVRG